MKFIVKVKDIPSRNPMAQALRHGLFRKKVMRSKKEYTRKGRRVENRNTCDSPFNLKHEWFVFR